MAYIGIDPGKDGAIALIHSKGKAKVFDYPGDETELAKLLTWIDGNYKISWAVIEQVHAMPNQGVVSTFSFGTKYGEMLGSMATLFWSVYKVTPQRWHKEYVFPEKGKDGSLMLARDMFPDVELHLKKHHNRAEALLIGEWGRRNLK